MNIKNEDDKHRYYRLIMKQRISSGQYTEAIVMGETYLTGKGVLYEEQPNPEKAFKERENKFFSEIAHKPIKELLYLEYSEDPEILRIGNITALLSDAMWSARDERTLYYHYLTSCYCLQNGLFDDLETVFYNGALRLIKKMEYQNAEGLIKINFAYADKYSCLKSRALIRYGAQISHWLHPLEETFEIYKNAKTQSIKEGLRLETNTADLMALDARIVMTCDPRDILKEIDLSVQNATISGSSINIKILTSSEAY
jgi:hypothetical protein